MNHRLSRTGKAMIFLAWIGAAALLSWFFARELNQRANPNQVVETTRVDQSVQVRLTRNRMGHYVATGRINGRSVEFFLDTGATHVAVGASLAEELNLKRGAPGHTRTANGTIVTYHTVLERVELGGITIRDVSASINPQMTSEDVLLGMSFLKHLELIQRGDQLLLRHTSPGT